MFQVEENYQPFRRGRKLSPDEIYVGRGQGARGRFGNPFPASERTTEEHVRVVMEYAAWLMEHPEKQEEIRKDVRGKSPICWCRKDEVCHRHIITEVANSESWDVENSPYIHHLVKITF